MTALLLQDENSGRDGRRMNEWFASRPDARLRAREAAAAINRPRIRKVASDLWTCAVRPIAYGHWIGLGKTPVEAYGDWERGQ